MSLLTLNREPSVAVSPERRNRWLERLSAACTSAPVAYLSMACLILRVMWGIWDFRDLSYGDSISYWVQSCQCFDRLRCNLVWSPLFEFLGSLLLRISHQPYFYCITMRLTLVMILGLLTLAIGRRLLPPGVAWFVSAWWVTLPINFNTLYEVHLFAAVPYMLTWLILLANNKSRWNRGWALALMVTSTVLIRNEQSLYSVLFSGAIVASEILAWRRGGRPNRLVDLLKPYLIPLTVALCLIGLFAVRSYIKPADFSRVLRGKHSNNIGQIYCVGFQQRHPGVWNKSPWTDYGDLMAKTFGAPEVTMTQAILANPPAMAQHFLWNASLIPTGLQLVLFNCISGGVTPDYISPRIDPRRANLLSLLVFTSAVAGLFLSIRQRLFTQQWAKPYGWALCAMGCYVPVAFFVMVMQRPRSSYIMAFGFLLMLLVGYSLWRILRNTKAAKLAGVFLPFAMLLTIVSASPYFPHHTSRGRPCLDYVVFLQPFKKVLSDDNVRVYLPDYSSEVACYLYCGDGWHAARNWTHYLSQEQIDEPDIPAMLERNHIGSVLVDFPWHTQPAFHQLEHAKRWKLIALRKEPDRMLALYTRSSKVQ